MRHSPFLWHRLLLALTLTAIVGSTTAHAETSAQRFERVLSRLTAAEPVDAVTAIWEGLELAPLVKDGPSLLTRRLEALQKARVPHVAGEANLALARLASATFESDQATNATTLASRLDALSQAAGVLHQGHVLGPFPGSGPGQPLPTPSVAPEDVAAWDRAPHAGKHGPTLWRAFSGAARLGPIALDDMLPSSGDLHAFIASTLDVAISTPALLVVGSNGPIAVWVDGLLLYEWDGERPLTDWQHAIPLALTPGRHPVIVRAGHRSLAPELTVRVVNASGLLPAGVQWSTIAAGDILRTPTAVSPAPSPDGAPADLWTLAARSRDPTLATARLAVWSIREAPSERVGARLIESAIAKGKRPAATLAELHYLLGRSERTDTSRSHAAYVEADRFAKGHAQALAALVGMAERVNLQADADAHARSLTALDPRHPTLLAHIAMRRLELADAASAIPVLIDDPRLAYNARLTSTQATLYERAGRTPEAAVAYARLSRLMGGASEPTQRAVTLLRRAGELNQALALVDEARVRRPQALDLVLLGARTRATATATLSAPGDAADTGLTRAIAELDAVRAFHSESPTLEEARGRLLLLAGERGKAIEAFDRALELAPQDRDLADYRRVLVSERGLAERWAEPVPSLIERTKAALKKTPDPRPNGARSIFERVVTQVFPSGLASQFRQLAIHIDLATAAERYETMAFPFTPGEDRLEILEAEVIRKDGTRLRPQLIGEQRDQGKSEGVYTLTAYRVVRFPPLVPGDLVHIQMRKDEIGSRNLFGDFFGVFFPLSSDLDKSHVEAIVEAPRTRPLFHKATGVGAPTVTVEGETQRLTFAATDLPGLVIEPSMPGYADVGAWVSVSTFGTWEALVTWYRELVLPQLDVPDDLAAIARDLIKGLPDIADPQARLEAQVAAIHGWVVEKTRYVGIEFGIHGFKPYKVAEIVKRGYGDCKDKASLLVAMLRVVSIKAELVLVRTRDLGFLEGTPATLWAFNHAIAYVPGLDLYLDATAENSGLRELPDLDQDAQVLRLDPWSNTPPVLSRIPMQSPETNKVTATALYQLDASGDAIVELEESIQGSSAGRLRGRFQDATRRDANIAQLLAAQHPGTELESAEYDNLDRLGAPVVIRARARMPRLAVRSGTSLEIPTALEPGLKLKQMTPLGSRRQPLIVVSLELEENVDRYLLPPGAKVVGLPAPVEIENRFARWSRVFSVEDGTDGRQTVTSKVRWELGVDRIAPKDYPEFRRLLEALARAETARIKIELPAAP